MFYVKNSQFP